MRRRTAAAAALLLLVRAEALPPQPSSNSTGDSVRDYWQTVSGFFAHVDYHGHLGSERSLTRRWESSWLTRFNNSTPLRGKRVGDYGIGAGLLGEVLCTKFAVGHYVGIDIASRQLEATARRFDKLPQCGRTLILQTQKLDFSGLGLDVLISQQVIQHFPSERYVSDWLTAVNDARIPKVFLEVRWAEKPQFSSWINNSWVVKHGTAPHRPHGAVTLAVLVNCQWMLQRLTAYKLEEEWTTTEGAAQIAGGARPHFQACSYSLLRRPSPGAVAGPRRPRAGPSSRAPGGFLSDSGPVSRPSPRAKPPAGSRHRTPPADRTYP